MGIKYRVLDLPPKGTGAFTPTPGFASAPLARAHGGMKITALLGQVPIPVPAPERDYLPPISKSDETQSSNVAPDAILKDQYVAYADGCGPVMDAGFGMATRRFAPLPVPARGYIYAARNAMIAPKIGGRAAQPWPRAFQRWPTRS